MKGRSRSFGVARRRAISAVAVLALSGVLVACGEKDEPDLSTVPQTETVPAITTPTPTGPTTTAPVAPAPQ